MRQQLRIIPRLDIKNDTVVKGIHLEGLRVVGVPAEAVARYYMEGADEVLYMDAVASLYERNSLKEIIQTAAEKIFVPLTVGGGIRTVEDIKEILRAGADKVAINTAAVKKPDFIKEASQMFGSQCIVGSIEAKKVSGGRWEIYIDTARESTGLDAIDWAQRLVDLGVGELLVTSIDYEGTKKGFEIDLIRRIAEVVSVPVIACGGCGHPKHIEALLESTDVSAVACASIFHYGLYSINEVKEYLFNQTIPVSIRL